MFCSDYIVEGKGNLSIITFNSFLDTTPLNNAYMNNTLENINNNFVSFTLDHSNTSLNRFLAG